jgi:hypothetical protein
MRTRPRRCGNLIGIGYFSLRAALHKNESVYMVGYVRNEFYRSLH